MSAMPQCGHLGLLMSRRKDDSEVAMDTACWAGRSGVPLMATRSSRFLGPSPGSKAPDVSSSPGPIRSRTAPQFAPRNGTHGSVGDGLLRTNPPVQVRIISWRQESRALFHGSKCSGNPGWTPTGHLGVSTDHGRSRQHCY